MATPVAGSYPPYFQRYIDLVKADSIQEAIEKYALSIEQFFKSIPLDKVDHRYAEGKWSIKEMLQHIIDAERVFAYRALCIARHDQTPLPGFDEGTYAAAAHVATRSWQDLLDEFIAVRKSTNFLLQSFTPDDLQQSGTTNGHPNTAVAICYTVFGHILHHISVLNERYL